MMKGRGVLQLKGRIIYSAFLIKVNIIFVVISSLCVPCISAEIRTFNLPTNSPTYSKVFTPPPASYMQTEQNNFGYYPLGGEDHTLEYLLLDKAGVLDPELSTLNTYGIINADEGYSINCVGNFKFIYTESSVSKDRTTLEHVQKFIEYFTSAWEEIERKKGYLMSGIGTYRDATVHVVIKDISPYEGKVEYLIIDTQTRDYTNSVPVIIVDNDYAYTLHNGDEDKVAGAMKVAAARELFHAVQYRYIEDFENLRLLADLPKINADLSFLHSRGINIGNALSNIEVINNRLAHPTQSVHIGFDVLPSILLNILNEYEEIYGALVDLKVNLRSIVKALLSGDPTIQCVLSDYCYVAPINPDVSVLFFSITNIHKYASYCSDIIEEYQWWLESMALWMEDEIYDEVNRYAYFLRDWIEHPERAVDYNKDLNFNYGNILLIKYIAEHYGEEIIRFIWELSVRPIIYVDNIRGIINEWRLNYQPDAAIAFAVKNLTYINNGIIYNPGQSTIADSRLRLSDEEEIVGNLLLELKTDIITCSFPEYYEIKALLCENMPMFTDYTTYSLQSFKTIGINPQNPGSLEGEVNAYTLKGLGSSYLLFIKPLGKWIDISIIGAQDSSYDEMTIAARLFSLYDTDPDSLHIFDNEYNQSFLQQDLEIVYVGKECFDNIDDLPDLENMLADIEQLENLKGEEQLEELDNLKNSSKYRALLKDVENSSEVDELLDEVNEWLHDLDGAPERINLSFSSNNQEIQMLALLIVNLSDDNDVPFLINIKAGPDVIRSSTLSAPFYYSPILPLLRISPLSGFIGIYPSMIPSPFISPPVGWGAFPEWGPILF
ncbi:MAG: hypothetical protein ACMUJM_12575 [bacterium]